MLIVTIYSFCAALTLYREYNVVVDTNPFAPYLGSALLLYIVLLYLNYSDGQLQEQPKIIAIKRINSISTLMTIFSFLLQYAYDGVLLKYVTWCFTFPLLLKMDGCRHPRPLTMSYVLSELTFVLNILYYMNGWIVWDALQYACSIAFLTYHTLMTRRVKQLDGQRPSYILTIWVVYGAMYTLYRVHIVTLDALYIIYIALDIAVKCIVTLMYQHQFIMHIPNTLGVLKAVRLIIPVLDNALLDNIVNKNEYMEMVKALDVTQTCGNKDIKDSLIKELYPNNAWKHILSPFNKHEIHQNMTILFCDCVNYSTYCMNHSIEEVIEYVHQYYCEMDSIISNHNVHKVETIGDAYLIVHTNVVELMECALHIARQFKEDVRIGIHYGTVASCTLGITKIRHAYVGHAVNMAARLESTGCPGKIHVSKDFVNAYECNSYPKHSEVVFTPLPSIQLKGIGCHNTYFANVPG